MTKQIKIEELIPLMKEGWVACDGDGIWNWFADKPEVSDCECWEYFDEDCSLTWEKKPIVMFNIKPADDWYESLIKIERE